MDTPEIEKQLFYDSCINQGLLLGIIKNQARIMQNLGIESGNITDIYNRLESEAMQKGEDFFEESSQNR